MEDNSAAVTTNHLVLNHEGNAFTPEGGLTKEEAIYILYQLSDGLANYEYLPMLEEGQAMFDDDDEISSWAAEAVRKFYDAGFLSVEGDASLHPTATMTKGEAAQLLYRYHLLTTKPDLAVDGVILSYEGVEELTAEERAANDAEAAAYVAALQSQGESSEEEENPHGVSYFASMETLPSEADEGTATVSWAGSSHDFITVQAFKILKAKTSTGYNKYTKSYSPKMAGCPYVKGINIVEYYAVKTDSLENSHGYAGHFYDPDKGDSYRTGTSAKNAYRNFNDHYYNAVVQWQSGQKKLGFKELGMAIHYLEDLNTPHHAANARAIATNHLEYENWVNTQLISNPSYYRVSSAPNDTYNYVMNSTFIGMANNWASLAKAKYPICKTYTPSGALSEIMSATKSVLGTAQRGSAGLLYRYLKNTGQM